MEPATARIGHPSTAAGQEEYDDTQTSRKPSRFPVTG